MLINLGDMTEGMGIIFIRNFMKTAKHLSCHEGEYLFKEGDDTHHFFTLIQGEFRLTIGTNKQQVYTVRHPGDMFGWSSLVGRKVYSATAVCTKVSDILRFDRDSLFDLLGRYPGSECFFFKKLAEMLGKRLLESYSILQGDNILGHSEPGTESLILQQ
jgi:CRP-like cAMP-binding protein